VTEQSDVYAFGILAYEVLTGAGPYVATGEAQLLAAHLQREPRRLRELRADVDVALANLIERCLAKDANRRPRAAELASALAASARTTATVAPAEPGGPLEQLLEELRKRRVYRVLAAYGAFALAVFSVAQGVALGFELSRRASQVLVLGTLAGFPIVIVLSWLYDIRSGRIHRARASSTSRSTRVLMWAGLGISIVIAAALGWLLLGSR
jgi:hypothetical protein